jgi:hypothetical protein
MLRLFANFFFVFVVCVCSLSRIGQLYGLEKLWGFLKYHKHKIAIVPDEDLKNELAKYKSADDFQSTSSKVCS